MIFFPAIDLKDGKCVRLLRGDMNTAQVYNKDPAGQARAFADAGCKWLHVVDLNGAFEGQSVNGDAIRSILDAVDIPIQLGGGIRGLETIGTWLDAGVGRVILGTAAVSDPNLVREACRRFPGRIAIGIDANKEFVAVEGWAAVSEITPFEVADSFRDAGLAAIIYTDISRDGAMEGPNMDATLMLAESISVPVIASGGVSSMDDIRTLKSVGGDVLAGVISGRAVYDGEVDPALATALLAGDS